MSKSSTHTSYPTLWRDINNIVNKDGLNTTSIKCILKLLLESDLMKNQQSLYMNIGFIHPEILNINKKLDKIVEYYLSNDNELLPILLNKLFVEANKTNTYLYDLVKRANKFEISTIEHLDELFKASELSEKLKTNLNKLLNEFKVLYLTIYYGDTFILDSFTVFNSANGNVLTNEIKFYLKGLLQYFAGILMDNLATVRALKTAIAAIMSRNMSHNIGSHVLAKVSSKKPENNDWDEWGKDFQILSQYLQQRQDFIAQIATEWPKWTYPTWLMKDIMRWFLSQKHLLNYIASSEGLEAHFYDNNRTSENDLRIHVLKSCKKIWYKKITEDALKNSKGSSGLNKWTEIINAICLNNCDECMDCALQKEKGCSYVNKINRLQLLFTGKADFRCCLDEDIQLAIPGGIIGNHAFYTILENVIRNGAKHSFTKIKKMQEENSSDEKLEIAFGPQEDIHMDVVIEFMDEDERDLADKQEYTNSYRVRIYDNVSFVTNSHIQGHVDIGELNTKLQKNIIEKETGELQKGNWGLAEMKISAGYLQKRDILEIGMGGRKVTTGDNFIIKAAISPLGTLAYEFRLPKPKEVGIVCKKD